MKQVIHEFGLREVATFLISNEDPTPEGVRPYLEDGYWELIPLTEIAHPCAVPQTYDGQIAGVLPGVIIRLIGFKMSKVSSPNHLTLEIRNGKVRSNSDGVDPDNSRSIPSGESPGENSGDVGKVSS